MLAHLIGLPEMTARVSEHDRDPLAETELQEFEKWGAELSASQIHSVGLVNKLQQAIMDGIEIGDAVGQRLFRRRRDALRVLETPFRRRIHGVDEPVAKPPMVEWAISCESFFTGFSDTAFKNGSIDFVGNDNMREALRHGPASGRGTPVVLLIVNSANHGRCLLSDLGDLARIFSQLRCKLSIQRRWRGGSIHDERNCTPPTQRFVLSTSMFTLAELLVVSDSGTLPSLMATLCGWFCVVMRTETLAAPGTHSRLVIFSLFAPLRVTGTSAPASPRFSIVTVTRKPLAAPEFSSGFA